MKFRPNAPWTLLLAANAMILCMLSFHQSTAATQRPPEQPFANAVQQRAEMIGELKQISALLKEQNALLRSGKLQVVVDDGQKRSQR